MNFNSNLQTEKIAFSQLKLAIKFDHIIEDNLWLPAFFETITFMLLKCHTNIAAQVKQNFQPGLSISVSNMINAVTVFEAP